MNSRQVKCVGLRVIHKPVVGKGKATEIVGTIIQQVSGLDKTTYTVAWDDGKTTRIDHPGNEHILVLDTTQIGVAFTDKCVGCKVIIRGFRWKCTQCSAVFLCNDCYRFDIHDISHTFVRFDAPDSPANTIFSKTDSPIVEVTGIFPKAKVKIQDTGKVGQVEAIYQQPNALLPDIEVNVRRMKETFRLGERGEVKLACERPASGGRYYVGHLPTPWELKSGRCAKAISVHEPEHENELRIKKGDLITAICYRPGNMLHGVCDGKLGIFPSKCLEDNYEDADFIISDSESMCSESSEEVETPSKVDQYFTPTGPKSFAHQPRTPVPPRPTAHHDGYLHTTRKPLPPNPPEKMRYSSDNDETYANDEQMYINPHECPFETYGNIDQPEEEPPPPIPGRGGGRPDRPPKFGYTPDGTPTPAVPERDPNSGRRPPAILTREQETASPSIKAQVFPINPILGTEITTHKIFRVGDQVGIIRDEMRFKQLQKGVLFQDFNKIRGLVGIVKDVAAQRQSLLIKFPDIGIEGLFNAELAYHATQ